MALFVYIIGVVTLYMLYIWRSDRLKGIPGPWGMPILGYISFLGRKMNVTIASLAKTYGPVYQVYIQDTTSLVKTL